MSKASIARLAASAAFVGLLCFLVSTLWLYAWLQAWGWEASAIRARIFPPRIDGILVFSSLVAAPLLEALPLIAMYFIAGVGAKAPRSVAFVLMTFAYGFAIHGMNVIALGRGLAFLMLGLLFQESARSSSVRSAYFATAFAHGIWNAIALLAIRVANA